MKALQEMVAAVASGQIPRESALRTAALAFQLSEEDADRLLGSAGQGFVPSAPVASDEG